ncbi:MAG TPA: glycosyltransferase family 39 protein [Patescibacteria group bacterium]|nr:glycosyltransferase family 39 protein [Patescibacteria group bacterium]
MKTKWLFTLPIFLFFIVGVLTLRFYGMNEDSPMHFLRGQAYLELLTTGNSTFTQPHLPSPILIVPGQRVSTYKLNASEATLSPIRPIGPDRVQDIFASYITLTGRQSFYKHQSWNAEYFLNNDSGHPPISDILGALFNRILYEKLGVMGDVESYQVFAIFCATVALFLVYLFSSHVFGKTAGILSVLFLATFPFFFSEMHYNIKDIPELTFFTGTIISFYFWFKSFAKRSGDYKLLLLVITSSFLALGTKFNAGFIPFILLPWIFVIRRTEAYKNWLKPKTILVSLLGVTTVLGLLIFFWPYLWTQTVSRLFDVIRFYSETGNTDLRIETSLPYQLERVNLLPPVLIAAITPPLTLLGFLLGIFLLLRKKIQTRYREGLLLFIWLIVPILRVVRPGADVFGSIRQFMEFLPAVAIISGVGIASLLSFLSQRLRVDKKILLVIFLAILSVFTVVTFYKYFPNENEYFNFLVGGPTGAQEKRLLDWQTNYDNPYRQTVNWLNANAPAGAKLAYLDGTMIGIPPIWLRRDIAIGSYFSGFSQQGEYVMSIVYPNPPSVFAYGYLDRFLAPVYEVEVDGVAVAKIWKNSPEFVRPKYKSQKKLDKYQVQEGNDKDFGPYWEIDMSEPQAVTSLTLLKSSQNCTDSNGLFQLQDFIVPERHDIAKDKVEFDFPAESSTRIRFYLLNAKSCFAKHNVSEIHALDN